MSQNVRLIVGLLAGFFVGSGVNMALIVIGPTLIPPPAGVDTSTMEALAENIHLFEPKHFIFPFLAHALGSMVGALVACLIAKGRQRLAMLISGGLFLMGGVAASIMIPAPMWFIVLDLVLAYLPAAWLGYWVARKLSPA